MGRDIRIFDILSSLHISFFYANIILLGELGENMDKSQMKERIILENYLRKYPDIFTDEEKRQLISWTRYLNSGLFLPDMVREVFDEIGLIADEENIYLGFIEMANEVFGLKDRNILEIGGGVLPRLAERIAVLQDKGSITVYDERLSKHKKDTEKLKLVRKQFDKRVRIDNVDLILALMPCRAAEMIIDVATDNNIDFMIALCEGGPHGDEFDFYEDEDEWQHSIIYSARSAVRDKNMGKLKIKDMDKYNNPYPVIYNDRDSDKNV